MSNKTYRTALGKQVDMGALLLKNENVRAVGNMGVNAKGDVINKKNETVSSKSQQVNQQYRKQIRNQIIDVPITPKENTIENDDEIEGFDTPLTDNIQETPEVTNEDNSQKPETPPIKSKKKTGGLASAIAKAREVEQKKLQTPREESRGKKGVKKI